MIDDTAVTRRFNLIQLLWARRRGATVREIAGELQASERTVRRDLNFLRQINYPISEEVGDRGRKTWRHIGNGSPLPLTFTYDEAAALVLARQSLQPLAGTYLGDAADSALLKIRCTLGESALAFFDKLLRVYHITSTGGGDYSQKSEIIDSLHTAIEEHRVTRLTYQSQHAARPAPRDVHPYTIVDHKGSLYLFAFDPDHQRVCRYKVDRIEQADLSRSQFKLPVDFDVQKELAGSLGIYGGSDDLTVVIRILPAAARFAGESKWHHSQTLTHECDGSVLVRLRLSSTVEIKSKVLSFGGNAVVLEPEEFRAEVAGELEHLLRTHYARSL